MVNLGHEDGDLTAAFQVTVSHGANPLEGMEHPGGVPTGSHFGYILVINWFCENIILEAA